MNTTGTQTPRYDVEQVRTRTTRLLERRGCAPEAAGAVADVLLEAELTGVRTHGLRLVPIYLERLARGAMNPTPAVTTLNQGAATAWLDGDAGPGPYVATVALDRCTDLAAGAGLAAVSVRNSNHFGPAGYYARRGARRGFITVATTNGSPAMAPWGSKQPFFAATPIAVGIPRESREPLVLDIALTASARARIRMYAAENRPIPDDWALDREGRPTTDPHEALLGALLPIGRHKGYGLAFVLEVLAAVLGGAVLGPDVRDLYQDLGGPQGLGHFFLAIRVGQFQGKDRFYRALDELQDRLHACPPAPGFERVLVPGEDQVAMREEQIRKGVALAAETVAALNEAMAAAGVPPLTPLNP